MESNLAYKEDWQEPYREELIDGKLAAMAPAATNHNLIAENIYSIFREYLRGKTCKPFGDGTIVYLTEEDHFIPDMMVVCDRSKLQKDGVHGAPDLLVEVLSPSTAKNDKTHKKDVYGACGVREYWLVDPVSWSVEQYLQHDGVLELSEIYTVYPEWMLARMTEKERAAIVTRFKCSLFDDLEISLEEIFEDLVP